MINQHQQSQESIEPTHSPAERQILEQLQDPKYWNEGNGILLPTAKGMGIDVPQEIIDSGDKGVREFLRLHSIGTIGKIEKY